jgi:predicted polyphosphate/ATP-dependent NAD kinase
MITTTRRLLKLALLAFAALCLATLLPTTRAMDLPPGFSMDTITDVSKILQTCNGDFGDIVSLYMVEAGPLIKKVETELKSAKETEKTLKEAAAAANSTTATNSTSADASAQSKATSEAEEVVDEIKEANKESGGAMAQAILNILASDEYETLVESETLKRISDNLDLACVMENATFVELFNGILASQNITEENELYPVLQDVPGMAAGYYDCGGRILTGLEFVQGAVPDVLKGGGFDPMSILSSPSFAALTSSGFDMACFFGVPEVSTLLAGVMG